MRLLRQLTLALALTGLVAAALAGCGTAPNAPVVDQPSASAPASAQPSVQAAGVQRTAEPQSLIGGLLDTVVGLLVRTLNLIGSIGGTLTNGRWKVAIPAGAVEGNATVTLSVSSLTDPHCQLGIYPSTLNHFDKPVTLTINCSSVPTDQLSTYVIYWLDPSTNLWVEVPGSTVNLSNKTVSAPLSHFSTYSAGPAGGKAGW
jgi:hypothetical protein